MLRTIERALNVLESVASAAVPPSVRDLASAIDHNVSSTYNIVNTLVGAGYLTKDTAGLLRLGNRISYLANGFVRSYDNSATLRPFVEEVSKASGETVYLSRLIDSSVVIQLTYEGRGSLRVSGLDAGFSGSEDHRAAGRSVMAFLPEERCLEILRANYPRDSAMQLKNRLAALQQPFALIRERKFAFDNEEFEPGVCCIAAPYFGADGRVAGSLAVSAPTLRIRQLRENVTKDVLRAVQLMSSTLGVPSDHHRKS